MSGESGVKVLQAPSGHDGVETEDDGGGEDAEVADESPRASAGELVVGTCGIGVGVAADDELGNHAGDAKQEDAAQIDEDEGCSSVLSCHIGETPDVSQTYCRPCGGKDDADTASETTSMHNQTEN